MGPRPLQGRPHPQASFPLWVAPPASSASEGQKEGRFPPLHLVSSLQMGCEDAKGDVGPASPPSGLEHLAVSESSVPPGPPPAPPEAPRQIGAGLVGCVAPCLAEWEPEPLRKPRSQG